MGRSALSEELYRELCSRDYPEPFCNEICRQLNTDYTAGRMLGYISHYETIHLEDLVDEMITILEDRRRFIEKAETEKANAGYNSFLEWRKNQNLSDEE